MPLNNNKQIVVLTTDELHDIPFETDFILV